VRLIQRPLPNGPGDRLTSSTARREKTIQTGMTAGRGGAPFIFAAGADGQYFNGKIDRPRLADRVLSETEMAALGGPSMPDGLWDHVLGC